MMKWAIRIVIGLTLLVVLLIAGPILLMSGKSGDVPPNAQPVNTAEIVAMADGAAKLDEPAQLARLLAAPEGERPNIILIVADDLGFNDVGYNGGDISTPHIDALAADGKQFESFYAMSFCTATRAGLLTGRWPIRTGMMRNVIWPWGIVGLPNDEVSMPEMLAGVGYENRSLVGKWHLGHAVREHHPLSHGFTEFVGSYNGAIDYNTFMIGGERDWQHNYEPIAPKLNYTTFEIARVASEQINSYSKAGPYMQIVAFTAPHTPLQAPQDYIDRYSHIEDPLRRIYSAMVTALDDGIGQIVQAVEESGEADNTVIIFMSDNGGDTRFGANNDPWRGKKSEPFEGGIRVPAFIRWPNGGLTGGGVIEGRLGYVDLLPTLAGITGASTQNLTLDGADLSAHLMSGQAVPGRDWFTYRGTHEDEGLSVISEDWKLVRQGLSILDQEGDKNSTVVLFDLKNDPKEQHNVAADNPEIVVALLKKLHKFRMLDRMTRGEDPYEGTPLMIELMTRLVLDLGLEPPAATSTDSRMGDKYPGYTAPKDWRIPAE